MTDKPKSFRYMWLLPLVMMALAILACDENYIPPPMIDRVEAQADKPGHAYVRVVNVGLTYQTSSNEQGKTLAYETSDYGFNWQPSEHVFADFAANSFDMNMSGENLLLNGHTIWTFPRSVFRSIFYDGSDYSSTSRFTLPYRIVSNSAEHDMLYMAMGTEGVLVGKLDENGIAPDWHLSAKGMDALAPLPLTITNPSVILGIILLIFFVPPFALIHAYLLQRVWVYLLPAAEARQMALKVTAGLVVLAIVGSVFWLTNERTDLYQVIAVLTVITVIVGVTATVLLAQKADVADSTRNRLVGASIIVSLIVPGGVAAIFAMWWLVFGLVFSYWAYHRVYWRYIIDDGLTSEGRRLRWRVDRLAIEMVLIIVVGIAAITLLVLIFGRGNTTLPPLFGLGLGVGGLSSVIRHYSSQRAKAMLMGSPDFQSNRELRLLSPDLWKNTAYWAILTIVLTGATLAGQAMAYSWFTTLLKTKPIP